MRLIRTVIAASWAIIAATSHAQTSQSTASAAASPADRPNIILILTDDQAPGTLGIEGNTRIRTPHLDAMAREGTYLPRAYVPTPQCAPSRASILTGLYPHDHGVTCNAKNQLDPSIPTLARLLRAAGYRCGLIGKWHLGSRHAVQGGFEDCWIVPDAPSSRAERYTRPTFLDRGTPRTFDKFMCDAATDMALDFIQSPSEQPFFLWLSYFEPHAPITPHPSFPYDPALIPDPESARDDLSGKPAPQRDGFAHRIFSRSSEGERAQLRADYYSMISAVDANVGRVIAKLREMKIDRRTLVLFINDNGWLLGEHQLWSKEANFYEELIRSPIIAWQPGAVPAGRRLDGVLAASFDLFPTLLGRAGLKSPAGLPGIDLWPVISGEQQEPAGRQELFLEFQAGNSEDPTLFQPMIGVVTLNHKYTRYLISGEEEFYDLRSDPREMINAAGKTQSAEVLAGLRSRVEKFKATIRKPYWTPEAAPRRGSGAGGD